MSIQRNVSRLIWFSVVAVAACSDNPGITDPLPVSPTYLGFDTSIYPGDGAMATWKASSPYVWSGYYLQAPCHRDSTWSGKRASLTTAGWGLAVIYVGQQTFDNMPVMLPLRSSVVEASSITCSRSLLSREQGLIDADDAIARTLAQGFPQKSVIYLDLERMNTIPPEMEAYYTAWAQRVLSDGRYVAGVYVHKFNAPAVYSGFSAVFQSAGVNDKPRFWLTTATGFSIDKKPTDIGYSFANIWQGMLDVDQTWNGVKIHIDVDVADSKSPSAP